MSQEAEWLRLQKKIFSRWVNQKLWMSRHIKVNDIVDDISKDPLVLLNLVEVLSEKKFTGKLEKSTKMRVQQISNMNAILKFIFDECGVQMKLKPSPEDMLDKKERPVLGLIFSIMMKFMKFGDEEGGAQMNAKEALLLWIQNKTSGYGLTVNNFTSSFQNGMVLCALIHKHRPKLINWDTLNPNNKMENIQLAMNAAEKYFGLEQYITPTEFTKLDEPSMVVYVSEYYYGIAEQRKLDQAARRIEKVIKFTKNCDEMRKKFAENAEQFKEKLKKVEAILEDRTIDNTMAGAKKKIEEFYEYKTVDKGEIIALQLNLEGLYNNLSMLLAHNKRPEFVPPKGLSLKDIEASMQHLETVEQDRKKALHAELNRQIKLVKLDEHHKSVLEKLRAWIETKEAYLQKKEEIESVGAARFSICTLDAFDSESKGVQNETVVTLKKIGKELRDNKYENIGAIDDRENYVDEHIEKMNTLSAQKRPVLEDDLARETFKEKVRAMASQHSDRFEKLSSWITEKEEYLAARESINSVPEAQLHIAILDAYDRSQIEMTSTAVASLNSLGKEILSAKYNTQYSSYEYEKPEEIKSRESTVSEKLEVLTSSSAEKRSYMNKCLSTEEKKEDLRVEFARSANDYSRWVKDTVENLSLALFGFTLEEVEAYAEELEKGEAEINSVNNKKQETFKKVWNEMESMGVKENPYTTLSLSDLEATYSQLVEALNNRRKKYEEELARQRANDALCKKFADLAIPLSQWITDEKNKISNSRASLQEQLEYVNQRISKCGEEGASRSEVDKLQKQIDEAGVTNNRHTTLTAKDLNVQWTQYEAFLEKKKVMLETEIEHQERRGISPEQFREIDETWKLFDKTGSGLDLKGLKACLYSLGEELTQSEVAKIMAEYGSNNVINYQGYRQFMLHLFGDTDTKEEILNGWVLISRGEDVVTEENMSAVMSDEAVTYVKETAPKIEGGYDFKSWTEDIFSR